ncbi:sugar-phosphatase [Clostridium botulinum]|uniref:Sugar-phosphatase n=1 Tax=Clostridium botulinum TaxID=1491 RepID=A0A846J4Z7_CLOBO|nr:sugar-phosphatase [Clostridium botulinum]ACA53851.1 HAD hydrolase, IIB family [Clostridium botulinum A3 str. Loch Maree]NFH65227.1 sugar-phosphatase [Clostridium botulinum]NFJ09008.1 sugar-phosphatase [Clostridium botulinum]NFK16276.1 sugar-phosphatase [Clostridium botulinum]NFM92423.1 sugar-phosphatase [Clostridium botulinum]
MYKLIALDMDGTLLNNKKTISRENKEAIKAAISKGSKVVLATGRPLKGIEKYLKELDLINNGDYAIAFNGALVQETKTGKVLYENNMTKEDLKILYKLSKELDVDIHFLTIDECYTPKLNVYSQIETTLNNIPLNIIDFDNVPDHLKIIKIMFVGSEEKITEIIKLVPKEFQEKYNVVRTASIYLEFLNKDTSKGYGVERLCNILNIDKKEVICAGDAENDIHMIEYAGLGVAMENAYPQVKKVANYITKNNEDHGVAQVINKFILNK